MTLLDELHTLVSLTNLYMATEFPSQVFPSQKRPAKAQPVAAQKAQVAEKPAKAFTPPPAKHEEKRAVEKAPLEIPVFEIPELVLNPLLSALARPLSLPLAPPLTDCVERLEKLSMKCQQTPAAWQVKEPDHPKLYFVSFFPPGSAEEQFLQKVSQAVTERRSRAELLVHPELEGQAFIWTLAASKVLKGVVTCYNSALQPKVASFYAGFGTELEAASSDNGPLPCRRALFGMPFYEVLIPQEQDAAFKGSLWKALQLIV